MNTWVAVDKNGKPILSADAESLEEAVRKISIALVLPIYRSERKRWIEANKSMKRLDDMPDVRVV